MIDKRTVFVLGAGASCPYGYPSGARLRELICYDGGSFKGGFLQSFLDYLNRQNFVENIKNTKRDEIKKFIRTFNDANVQSIDVFMDKNPSIAPIGKYIIAFEIFRAEQESVFGEYLKRKKLDLEDAIQDLNRKKYLRGFSGFHGGDWYFYLYNRLIKGLVGKDALPDFSNGNISFITFNYDRSLEQSLYESLRNTYTEVSEDEIIKVLKQLNILHIYGRIAPLKWQSPKDYIDYKPQINETLLQNAAKNIRTIFEEKQNPELIEAQNLLKDAEQIFFLGFGYALENMGVLNLPAIIPQNCFVYGTAFESNDIQVEQIHNIIINGKDKNSKVSLRRVIKSIDCLELLKNYFE